MFQNPLKINPYNNYRGTLNLRNIATFVAVQSTAYQIAQNCDFIWLCIKVVKVENQRERLDYFVFHVVMSTSAGHTKGLMFIDHRSLLQAAFPW
jgi:hypothetical protein